MKVKAREKIIKNMEFPVGFLKRKDVSYKVIDYNGFKYIVGFCLDSTSDEERFFVQYFTQPLFIPFTTFVFTLGNRIGSYWNSSMIDELETAILKMSIPKDIYELLAYWEANFKKFDDNYKYQSVGLTYLLMSNYNKCIKELEKVSFKDFENQPLWKQEELVRIKEILFLVQNKEYDKSLNFLLEWQDFTLKSLKINNNSL